MKKKTNKESRTKGYVSLNGEQLRSIKGGFGDGPSSIDEDGPSAGNTDNLCGSCPYHRNG
ncbi:MAG: hypothetical protein WCX48_07655 [Bacteroidales bacterium]